MHVSLEVNDVPEDVGKALRLEDYKTSIGIQSACIFNLIEYSVPFIVIDCGSYFLAYCN